MSNPLTTPCGHNFCKECLEGAFAGQSSVRERGNGRQTLRAQKNVMKCPSCANDIADFLQNLQVNRQLMDIIESILQETAAMKISDDSTEDSSGTHKETDPADGTDDCNNSEVMEEVSGKDQAEAKPQQQIYHQNGTNGGNQKSTVDGDNGRSPAEGPDVVSGKNEGGAEDTEMTDIKELSADGKPRLGHKCKKANDAGNKLMVTNGGRTRGKRSKTTVA